MRPVVGVLCGALLLTGCSAGNSQGQDELQVAATLVAATPAASPAVQHPPTGQLLPGAGPVRGLLVDDASRTLIAVQDDPPQLTLRSLDALQSLARVVALPGRAGVVRLTKPGGPLAVPVGAAGRVIQVSLPDGGLGTQTPVAGGPTSAQTVGERTLATVQNGTAVAVLGSSGLERTITGFAGASDVLPAGANAIVVDQLRTSVTEIDPATGAKLDALRAGNGATNAVTDKYGRVLVVDTRNGELLVFSTNPLLMRQRYPVPGTPFGLAYDPTRNLAWITLTDRNEVVGFAMTGGEPVEKYRFPTVRQPNSVAVDARTGQVVIGSAADGEVQVMQP